MQQAADTAHIATVALSECPYIIPIATHTVTQTNTHPPSSVCELRSWISPGACQTKEKLKLFRGSCREVLTA